LRSIEDSLPINQLYHLYDLHAVYIFTCFHMHMFMIKYVYIYIYIHFFLFILDFFHFLKKLDMESSFLILQGNLMLLLVKSAC